MTPGTYLRTRAVPLRASPRAPSRSLQRRSGRALRGLDCGGLSLRGGAGRGPVRRRQRCADQVPSECWPAPGRPVERIPRSAARPARGRSRGPRSAHAAGRSQDRAIPGGPDPAEPDRGRSDARPARRSASGAGLRLDASGARALCGRAVHERRSGCAGAGPHGVQLDRQRVVRGGNPLGSRRPPTAAGRHGKGHERGHRRDEPSGARCVGARAIRHPRDGCGARCCQAGTPEPAGRAQRARRSHQPPQ